MVGDGLRGGVGGRVAARVVGSVRLDDGDDLGGIDGDRLGTDSVADLGDEVRLSVRREEGLAEAGAAKNGGQPPRANGEPKLKSTHLMS